MIGFINELNEFQSKMRVTPEDIQHLEEEIKELGKLKKLLPLLLRCSLLTFQRKLSKLQLI